MSQPTASATQPADTFSTLADYLAKNPHAQKWANPPTITGPADYLPAVLATELVPSYQKSRVYKIGSGTEIEAEPWHFRFNHGWAGLVSEQKELFEPLRAALKGTSAALKLDRVNIGEELGDRFWYHALISAALGEALNNPGHTNLEAGLGITVLTDDLNELMWEVVMADSQMGDGDKRLLQHSKKPPAQNLYEEHKLSIRATNSIASALGFEPLTIMRANIAKLYRRKLNGLMKGISIGDMQGRDLATEKTILASALSAG